MENPEQKNENPKSIDKSTASKTRTTQVMSQNSTRA